MNNVLINVNETNFDKEVLECKQLCIVDFWGDNCQPCKMLAQVLDEMVSELTAAKIMKIKAVDNRSLAINYNLKSVPTLLFFKDGKEVGRLVGVQSKATIRKYASC